MLLLRLYAVARQAAARKQPAAAAQLGKLMTFGKLAAMAFFFISARLYATSDTEIAV
jgi:hypothetical protein